MNLRTSRKVYRGLEGTARSGRRPIMENLDYRAEEFYARLFRLHHKERRVRQVGLK